MESARELGGGRVSIILVEAAYRSGEEAAQQGLTLGPGASWKKARGPAGMEGL